MLGQNTSQAEVTHISSHGIWILILNIQEPFPDHFYWPDLDVDLSKEIIKNPERFPLKAQS
ncbi:MAG: integron cassette protein [Microcystis aeruginosa LG11-05]|nr:integron cassette protein [Microcystis aeruginosa LG11-05]